MSRAVTLRIIKFLDAQGDAPFTVQDFAQAIGCGRTNAARWVTLLQNGNVLTSVGFLPAKRGQGAQAWKRALPTSTKPAVSSSTGQ